MNQPVEPYHIAWSKRFHECVDALDNTVQSHILSALTKLQKGLRTDRAPHPLEHSEFWSFGIGYKGMRVICLRADDGTLIMLHAASHQDAYRWAERHHFQRVGDVMRIIEFETQRGDATDASSPQAEHESWRPPGPFEELRDKDFARLGVPPYMAAFLRDVPDIHHFENLMETLHPALAIALIEYADGGKSLQDALFAMEDHQRDQRDLKDPARVREALTKDINRHLFFLAPEDQRVLTAMLSGDFEAWRVYLHPSQRRWVQMRSGGAIKVTGGPGTGKTVVLLHRARYLAEEVFPEDPRPILLTSFSRALTQQLRHDMATLCSDDPTLMERFAFTTVTALAQRILADTERPSTLLDDEIVRACWDEALASYTGQRPRAFFRAEREQVLAREGRWTGTAYIRNTRHGRNTRIRRHERKELWEVFEAFEAAMRRRGGGDRVALAREATHAVITQNATPYAAILCDELQDVDASSLRLLAALTRGEDGKIRANALSLAGDNYQSLYQRPIALSRCGIEVRGRSAILKRNYRTTEGIRRAAIEVVRDIDFDETEDDDATSTIDGYVSTRTGSPPERFTATSRDEEADLIAAHVEDPDTTAPILVLARTNAYLDQLLRRLHARGVQARKLERRDTLHTGDEVVCCSMHRAKGLEAPHVILAGAQLCPMDPPDDIDAGMRPIWQRQERCLQYVAITRAQHHCVIITVDPHESSP